MRHRPTESVTNYHQLQRFIPQKNILDTNGKQRLIGSIVWSIWILINSTRRHTACHHICHYCLQSSLIIGQLTDMYSETVNYVAHTIGQHIYAAGNLISILTRLLAILTTDYRLQACRERSISFKNHACFCTGLCSSLKKEILTFNRGKCREEIWK